MTDMLQKAFTNSELNINITSFIDKKQVIWFKGKDVSEILGYKDTSKAIRQHVSIENKITRLDKQNSCPDKTPGQQNSCPDKTPGQQNDTRGKYYTLINEAGFYELVFSSKLELAKKFRQWVFASVLPSIRKFGQFKMFDAPWNKMILISNEKELHHKVGQLIRKYYPDAILVAAMGENQDTDEKRINSWKCGYQRGTPDLMILDFHRDYKGLCIEFKSPNGNYCIPDSQIKMKEKYKKNNYAYILSNDYDSISRKIHKYMAGVRIPCEFCTKAFCTKNTLNTHLRIFHRIEKNI